ncbi:ammonium transporter [Castellaniella denitrificans]|uniref:Ammonium transporter n=1 Tax=Castellaniella denitrificans TaxID=56119 RepID=A0ABT4M673_9BURK|nr:ammonium transporter [Castellaniella denitrificans]MCZ4330814.1 ammonium transporter [Castellaniella denitrificans]
MDKSDLVWTMTSTLLVWLMCVPGLALFYGGLARKRHALSVMTQTLGVCALITVLWFAYGYSLVFTEGFGGLGGWTRLGLAGLYRAGDAAPLPLLGTIPELLFALFQATFAAITCGLITGSMAERTRFGAALAFAGLWFTMGYMPIAHMVWAGDGWLHLRGALDFAGGTVVHISAGVAGLVGARWVGPRLGYGREPMLPHSLPLNLTGAALLWIGWFGFNGGSALAANEQAVLAVANTLLAAVSGVLAWALAERILKGRASLLGAASGAIAGLVGITPAAGLVAPGASLVIGVLASWAALWGVSGLKRLLGIDDAFDVFGIHAVGGIVGAILTGIFYSADLGGPGPSGLDALLRQVWLQAEAVLVSLAWAALSAAVCAFLVDRLIGLRAAPDEERQGLDAAEHGETAYPD